MCEKLLTQAECISHLTEIVTELTADAETTTHAAEVIYELADLTNQYKCCVKNWQTLSDAYQNTACTLDSAAIFAAEGSELYVHIHRMIRAFEKAKVAAKPYVIEQVRKQANQQHFINLGFPRYIESDKT
jgi:hypothetical protein